MYDTHMGNLQRRDLWQKLPPGPGSAAMPPSTLLGPDTPHQAAPLRIIPAAALTALWSTMAAPSHCGQLCSRIEWLKNRKCF